MRKLFYALPFIMGIVITGCEDDIETSAYNLEDAPVASIEVHGYAELNNAELGNETVPDGTRVTATVENSEFFEDAHGAYQDSATFQNGVANLNVPVTSSGVEVSVSGDNFVYDQQQQSGETVEKLFLGGTREVSDLNPGDTEILQVNYSSQNFGDAVEMRNISINQCYADLDETQNGDETVSGGTSVFIYAVNYNWEKSVDVSYNGSLEVTVPSGIELKAYFEETKTLWDGTIRDYRFETDVFNSNYYSSYSLNFPNEEEI